MSREQERIRRKLEKNPAMECNKVRQKYCPDLFQDFAETKDPKHLSYAEYSNGELLGIVNWTQTYSGSRKLNGRCLERHYNKGTEDERVNYHCDVLEAKIVLGEGLVVSICSEFIENNGEDAGRQKQMSEEERIPMADGHPDNQKKRRKWRGRQKTLEDRE